MNRRSRIDSIQTTFSDLRADYTASKTSRFRRRRTGLAPGGGTGDFHLRNEADYYRVMEEARDMERNDAVVGATVERVTGNTVQDGFRLDFDTGDERIDADLWARWNAWATDAEQCDAAGELPFMAMESMAFRRMIVDGDIVALPEREGPALQLIEGHRIRSSTGTTRNVILGVLLGERRRRLEYWIAEDDLQPNAAAPKLKDLRRVPTRDNLGRRQVFHLRQPRRVTQTRGVTAFAPIFDLLGMFEDIQFAKLVQQQVCSCFAVLEEIEMGVTAAGDARLGERTTEARLDGSTKTVEGISPGMYVRGDPGSKLQGFSPNVPNPEFFPHVRLILQLIGINLGAPLVLLLMDASETNFSGWRGAVDEARRGFRNNQAAMIAYFHDPILAWKLGQWVADDAILRRAGKRMGISLQTHHWHPPRWPYVQPLQDRQAEVLALKNNLSSPRRLRAQQGEDWEDIVAEGVADRALLVETAADRAQAINARFGPGTVDWRELAGFDLQGGPTADLLREVPEEDATNVRNAPSRATGEGAKGRFTDLQPADVQLGNPGGNGHGD